MPLIVLLIGCSDLGSSAEVEILQQHEQLRSDLQRLESTTTRSSLREALDDPRLHPYALARAIYEQSELQAQAPTFLVQFVATLVAADVAPALVDQELDTLLEEFDEMRRQMSFYTRSPEVFYLTMLRLSQKTANTERTEVLRQRVEQSIANMDNDSMARRLRSQLIEFYIEIGEPELAHPNYEQIEDSTLRVLLAISLAKAYAEKSHIAEANQLIDEFDSSRSELVYLIEDWVKLLLLVDRKEQAIEFLYDMRDAHLNVSAQQGTTLFFTNSMNLNMIIRLLRELGREIEAREALVQSYYFGLENHPGDWFLLRGMLPYLKGFQVQGEQTLFEEAKRDLFNRLYAFVISDERFQQRIFEFTQSMKELGLEDLGREFIDRIAVFNSEELQVTPAMFYFSMSYAYGMLGDNEKAKRYLQPLLDDFSLLEQLFASEGLGPSGVLTFLLEAGHIDEAKALLGRNPDLTHVQLVLQHLITSERLNDALAFTAEHETRIEMTIFMLLRIASGYLQQGQLPNAQDRALMAQHWSQYMPMAKEN
ncbi:MAG: hypothetical protein LAT77_08630 [Aliidiomarina sp.]|uniref:hypothetical protein n=1 Tax=Aliidiomarina sp. TaxID=1872439 RepID=UPI0025C01E5A|nr:hypothetical protein [Aliidiomarina sp.]MCH8501958.1 hypothetical protein [Aliidiomarina sp.]